MIGDSQDARALPCIGKQYKYARTLHNPRQNESMMVFIINDRIASHKDDHGMSKLDPVGSTVRYEMMKLCTGSV